MELVANNLEWDARIDATVRKLAEEMARKIGYSGEEGILLSDSGIAAELRKQAQEIVREEDEKKAVAEMARKKDILQAARKELWLGETKPRPSLVIAPKDKGPSAWQKYLEDKSEGFLPPVLRRLISPEEVSAARGFLIGEKLRHTEEGSSASNWTNQESIQAMEIWKGRAQDILNNINRFFPKDKIPQASREVFSRVRELIMSESELAWFLDGPQSVVREQEEKAEVKRRADEQGQLNRQKELVRLRRREEMTQALLDAGISGEEAMKLAKTLVKKFPGDLPSEAFAKMAMVRQSAAILKDRRFMDEIAPEAELYANLAGLKKTALIAKACQEPAVSMLLEREKPGYGEMDPAKAAAKKAKKKGGGKK
ncbi:MAG: hypothetical protein ACOYS2_02055 [Patescibacteria group bacterium]